MNEFDGSSTYGTLEEVDSRWRLTFTRRLAHAPEKVWRALTEPQHLAAWFPTDIEGERRAGARLRFSFREDEGPDFEGAMIEFDPPSALEFKWGDADTLRFVLQPDGDGCLLTFVNTFDELGKAARDAAGWHACLDVLGYHLNAEEPPWSPQDRWQQVHSEYVGRLGDAASTIGPPAASAVRRAQADPESAGA